MPWFNFTVIMTCEYSVEGDDVLDAERNMQREYPSAMVSIDVVKSEEEQDG